MASISDVINDQLAACSVALSPVRLETLLIDHALDGDDFYTAEKAPAIKTAILSELTRLLAMPDVTEGTLSLKWDRGAISRYCDTLRLELGISLPDTRPTLTDRSSIW